ncbi:hypothetical protein N7532_002354 [Penicillium argentinense]|uniref:Uncharacterized protein n=1 Tax=Penicillium argentinense TaxID=1131581 RepID=A0A9W9KK70_9EURO|nr:uncharacterized protein N7532_002354 [Penicillium argentinense]KAJ5109709.1 hypothetical protein N7532_002354 [Penicillium argentinense]
MYHSKSRSTKTLSPLDGIKSTSSSKPKPSQPVHYKINPTFWKRNYEISGTHPIFVENSTMTPGKPDLTFHAGDSHGPVLGVARYRHFSSDIEIGLSDHPSSNPGPSMRWQSLHRDGLSQSRYRFTTDMGNGRLESFTWRATHPISLTRDGSMELLHDSTHTVAATFSSKYSMRHTEQSLKVYPGLGGDIPLLALVTALTLYEKMRRRKAATSAATGAGVGAGAGAGAGA